MDRARFAFPVLSLVQVAVFTLLVTKRCKNKAAGNEICGNEWFRAPVEDGCRFALFASAHDSISFHDLPSGRRVWGRACSCL